MNFQDMSPDVLLLIFRYCSYADKLNLYYVNRKFRDLLNHHVFRIINKDFIITSQNENNWMNKRLVVVLHYLSYASTKYSYNYYCFPGRHINFLTNNFVISITIFDLANMRKKYSSNIHYSMCHAYI